VNPGSGRALAVKKMEDHFNIVNALQDGASNSVTSFEVHWAPGVKHFKVRDRDAGNGWRIHHERNGVFFR